MQRKATAAISKSANGPIDIMPPNRLKLARPRLKGLDFAWSMEHMRERDMLQSALKMNKLVSR
jgi:hypothetical protein